MPRSGPIFQDHHTIEQQTLEKSRLLTALDNAGFFDIHAPENRIFLPADPQLAHVLGITPHSGGPIADYQRGTSIHLVRIEQTPDGIAAITGDPEALKRIAGRVELLRDTMKAGLINGDLNTNAPLGMSADDIRPKVRSFYGNPQSYSQTHVQQIDGFKSLSNAELNWTPIAHSETRLLSTLQYMEQSSNNLTRGGDPEIGRQSLTQAVTQAHASGRLTLSDQGILQFEQTFGEEAASPLRVPRGQRGFISPELLVGDLSANQALRMGGIAATGLDAYQTTMRTSELWSQDNATAANEQWARFGARNAIGWGGGTIAAAAGVTGAGPWALVAADLYLLTEAADRGISHWQNQKIYTQEDRDEKGVTWAFNGKDWIREDLRADRVDDGQHDPQSGRYSARPEKAQQLSYQAGVEAAEQALGNVPTPLNPFVQPVSDSDPAHFATMRWAYNVEREQWSRQVADSADHNGAPEWNAEPEYASPERKAQLNTQALQTIDANLMVGPAAIAMRYEFGHKAYGYGEVGEVPASVTSAMTTDRLKASDERYYERDAQGTWTHGGEPAPPQRALELDVTHARLQSAMQGYEIELAKIPAWKPPTPEQADRAEFRALYVKAGLNPDVRPEEFEAAYAAVKQTRSEHGIGPKDTALELEPVTAGKTIADIEIRHTRRVGADEKEVVPVAVTTSSDIAAARRERPSLGGQEGSPQQNAPEQTIALATPEQRDAREQAQREANRQGLSHDDAQQAVHAATAGASARAITMGGADARTAVAELTETPQAKREQAQDAPIAQNTAQAAAIEATMRGPRDPDTVYPGDRNDQVGLLQYRLDQQGYRGIDGQPLSQDGRYDDNTVFAVAKFQQAHDLPATGIADQQTQYEAARAQPVSLERTIAQATPEEPDRYAPAQQTRAAMDDRHTAPPVAETPREQPQPQTVATTPERETSPEPEHVAKKIEPITTPERQTEITPPISADREPQEARTVATPAHDSDTLRLGGRGDDVELLQYRLDRQGYRGPDGAPIPQTGQYSPETEHAVRQFQTLHGIPATGIADQDTRDAVDRALAAQREQERGEPGGPNRSPSPESTPTSETPAPVIASRTVGLSASRSGDDAPEREAEHAARAEAPTVAPTATAPDPALAHHAVTRDERDDERQSRTDPDRTQPASPEPAQPVPSLMTHPGHPAHAMYTQAFSLIERGDVVPTGTMTQEDKSKLAAGVVAQFLAEDNRATRIDALYASTHNAPGMPAALIPVQGDPTTDYCRRASIDVTQALQTPLEQSSTVAQTMAQAREQALAKEQAEEQARKERQEKEGPVMRIGPRTQGPQDDGGSGDGGGGGDGG